MYPVTDLYSKNAKEMILIASGLFMAAFLLTLGALANQNNKSIDIHELLNKPNNRTSNKPSSFKQVASSLEEAAKLTKLSSSPKPVVLLTRKEVIDKIKSIANEFKVKNIDLVDKGDASYVHFKGKIPSCEEAKMLETKLGTDDNIFQARTLSAIKKGDSCYFYMTLFLTNIKS